MVDQEVIEKILLMNDSEIGGENALNGFEFQVSSAIYLMFLELKNKNDFALIYEKIEDFVIITDKINLYQAKSTSGSLTPNMLCKKKKNARNDNSGLSIIEKMYSNFLLTKNKFQNQTIETTLVTCENQRFSHLLKIQHENLKEEKKINFRSFGDTVKSSIVSKTKFDTYEWEKINAVRLIPKSHHEEVTRVFVADTITDIRGENKIDSKALYDSLCSEIKKIRKKKEKLTSNFLLNEITKYSKLNKNLEFRDYVHFLNEEDKLNIPINKYFGILKNTINLKNSSEYLDFEKLSEYYKNNNFLNIYDFYKSLENNENFEDLFLIREVNEIKAMILLVIGKEGM